ncbi:MAG: SpoIIE family protein phosphatase [Proteobacteria bacterium]|nr:SpoIIE family protein phosphatase [Pseudomonadota bacterium]
MSEGNLKRAAVLSCFIVSTIFVLLPGRSLALEPVTLPDSYSKIQIGKHIELLEDPNGLFTIDGLTASGTSDSYLWIASKKEVNSFGYTKIVYWVKFSVINPHDRDSVFFLVQDYPMIDHVDLYISEKDKGFAIIKNGDGIPFNQRQIEYRDPVFQINIPAKSDRIYYLRYQTASSLNMPLSIQSSAYFYKHLNIELPILWLYYGLLLSMIIYNIFLYISVKDINFLYYVLFIVFYMLFQMALNGLAFQYLWPDSIWWANNCLPLFMCLAYFWGSQFGRSLMEFKKQIPKIDKIIVFCLFMAVIGMVLSLTAPYRIAIIYATAFIVTVVITITTSFYLAFKKSRPALFFAISWGCMALGITLFALKSFSILPHNFLTQWSVQIGSAIQAVLLAIVLTDQINSMRKKLQKLNVDLEHKVMERTQDLQSAKDALWGEMQVAKKIQTVLLPKNPKIEGYEISALMVPADEIGGDYYDVIHADEKDWIVIGDVSGHGIPAGLIMMMVQTAIKTTLQHNPSIPPSQLLELINVTITSNIKQLEEDKYMSITVFACHENGRFCYSGLHQDIMVYRKEKAHVELIETRGMWIGIEEDIKGMFENDEIILHPGDTMMIYTDGITEALQKNKLDNRTIHMFGEDYLKRIFSDLGNESTLTIRNGIIGELKAYECKDDTTMLIIKRMDQ